MSLRVWLPLISDLHNQGVSGLTPVQTTAPTWVDGKLGKAMSTGALYLPANGVAKFYNNNAMSFAFWIYAVGSSGSSVVLGQSNMSVGNNRMFTIFQYPSPNDLHLSWQSNESSTAFLGGVLYGVFPSGTWTHCAITYDGAKASVYINGVYQTSWNGVSTRTNFTYDVPIPSTSIRYLNDVRIYDHALSPKEVKLLSQGLVAHYKLDDNVQQMNNCFNYPTFDTSAAAGGWYHWGYSGHLGTYGQNTNKNYIFNVTNTYSHWVANGDGATGDYLCYQSPAFEGGYRSLVCILKEENSSPITENIIYPAWNDNDTSSGVTVHQWTSIQSLENGFYLCKCEGFKQKGSNDLVGVYIKPGYKVYISEAYLENDRTVCSNIFYPSNVVYDSSGYNNHGTPNDLTVSTNSARNSLSTKFNGTSSNIVVTSSFASTVKNSQMSFAFWMNRNNYTDGIARYIYYDYCDIYIHTDYKMRISWMHDTASSSARNTWASGLLVPANEWHHVCFTFSDGVMKVYCDGTLNHTSDRSSTGQFMGVRRTGGTLGVANTDNYFGGSISDFRIYATALSAEDILELYHTSASIDKDGNFYAYELKEV